MWWRSQIISIFYSFWLALTNVFFLLYPESLSRPHFSFFKLATWFANLSNTKAYIRVVLYSCHLHSPAFNLLYYWIIVNKSGDLWKHSNRCVIKHTKWAQSENRSTKNVENPTGRRPWKTFTNAFLFLSLSLAFSFNFSLSLSLTIRRKLWPKRCEWMEQKLSVKQPLTTENEELICALIFLPPNKIHSYWIIKNGKQINWNETNTKINIHAYEMCWKIVKLKDEHLDIAFY